MMVAMQVLPEETRHPLLDEVERLMSMERPLTVDDLDPLFELESGYRFELDEGVLVISGAPLVLHQIVSAKLTYALMAACPPGMIVIPATGVLITGTQFRIPDLVVTRTDALGAKYLDKPPLLAVEIASPSTGAYDRTRKKQVCADFGIKDYWIITPDPKNPDITAFTLTGKHYTQDGYAADDGRFTTSSPFPVSFTPAELVSTGAA